MLYISVERSILSVAAMVLYLVLSHKVSSAVDQELLSKLMDENSKSENPLEAREVTHEAMVQSALLSAARAQEIGLPKSRIILSAKVSAVQDLIACYKELARRSDYALHLGLTEAGMGSKGVVASSAAMGVLLQQGIGDTIRVSLTPEPGGDRTREVIVAQEMLQTMGLRSFVPLVTSCPGCGRTTSTVFQELAAKIQGHIRERMPEWRETYDGVEEMNVAVMGCIVNGPGESKHANIGISLPGILSINSMVNYYLALGFAATSAIILLVVTASPVGLILQAAAQDPVAAESLGFNIVKYKVLAFALSALFSGLAGALLVFYMGTASVSVVVAISVVLQIIIAAIIGGRRTILGPILGSLFIIITGEWLQSLGQLDYVAVSILALIILLFFPDGIAGIVLRKRPSKGDTPVGSRAGS